MAFLRPTSVFVLLLAASSAGCGTTARQHTAQKPVPEPAEDRPEEPPTAAAERSGAEQRSFRDALAERLEKVEMQIVGLREKVAAYPAAVKAEWDGTIAALEAEARAARERLGEVERAAHDAWHRLRDEATAAWDRLEESVKKALADSERAEPAERSDEPAAGEA